MSEEGYTQREWDRTVGWGKVPDEYKKKKLKRFPKSLRKNRYLNLSDQNRYPISMKMTNNEHAVQYTRGTSYYKLKAKYESLSNAHRLYKRQIELWDTFYLLDVISYGELQRNYRSFGNST